MCVVNLFTLPQTGSAGLWRWLFFSYMTQFSPRPALSRKAMRKRMIQLQLAFGGEVAV